MCFILASFSCNNSSHHIKPYCHVHSAPTVSLSSLLLLIMIVSPVYGLGIAIIQIGRRMIHTNQPYMPQITFSQLELQLEAAAVLNHSIPIFLDTWEFVHQPDIVLDGLYTYQTLAYSHRVNSRDALVLFPHKSDMSYNQCQPQPYEIQHCHTHIISVVSVVQVQVLGDVWTDLSIFIVLYCFIVSFYFSRYMSAFDSF